jgi:hypothetical protein
MNRTLEPPSKNRSPALNEILLDYLRTIDSHSWPGIDGLTLDVVLESYARLADSGQVPGKSELLRQHPELAAELEALFAKPELPPNRPASPDVSPLYFEHTD